ncbi:MAG: YqhA family protein [Streptosporangiales bacterium]
MTEPNSRDPEPEGEPTAGPGAPRPRPARPTENRFQRNFERGLGLAQLTVLLPVVVLLVSGVGAFVYASVYAVHAVGDITRHPFYLNNLRLFLTEIDVFLIGATLIIAAFGLYELFIARVDPDGDGRRLPAWLEMHDLNDLKARVISMIILVTAVTFTDVLLDFDQAQALDVLYLGAGVAIVIGALTVYLRYGSDTPREPARRD